MAYGGNLDKRYIGVMELKELAAKANAFHTGMPNAPNPAMATIAACMGVGN